MKILQKYVMKKEFLEVEKAYWNAIEKEDFDTIKKMTHFPCIVAGRQGTQALDEAAYKKMMDAGKDHKLKVLEISQTNIETVGNTVFIGYLIEIEHTVNTEKNTGKYACTSAWVKEGNEWKCVLHTESDLAKP